MSAARKLERCHFYVRTGWMSPDARCLLQKGHKGPCASPSAETKPALAQEHSQTSRDAAGRAEGFRTDQQRAIWLVLSRAPRGLTTEEICDVTGWDGDTVRPRLVELDEQGRARRMEKPGADPALLAIARSKGRVPGMADLYVTRKNRGGNQMVCWEAVR